MCTQQNHLRLQAVPLAASQQHRAVTCVHINTLIHMQEVMTDPSYKGQFVCFTCPHIGNVGINKGERHFHE